MQTGILSSGMNHNVYCPPFGYQASVMRRSHESPDSKQSYFQRKEDRHASFAEGNLAQSSVTTAMQSGAVTGLWTAKCYICSILILFKDSKAV